MSKLGSLLIFAVGVGLGSGATYFYLKDKFELEQSEREEQLKAAYDAKYNIADKVTVEVAEEGAQPKVNISLKESMMANKKDITDYANIVKKENYSNEKEEEKNVIDGEIIIEPDNYDDIIGFGMQPYDVVFATIYADGYLVDSEDHIIDIDMIGGKESLEHFGEGDDPELLHVRNNLYEIDYEIDRDDRTYAEVSGKDPADLPDLD